MEKETMRGTVKKGEDLEGSRRFPFTHILTVLDAMAVSFIMILLLLLLLLPAVFIASFFLRFARSHSGHAGSRERRM